MLDKILDISRKTLFDFRKYAYPDDELSYLFEQWIDYYRLKYAICQAISPKSILEIGVRYGYSAVTFLEAAPGASYLGIDNNSATFGGSVGAIEWARKITQWHQAGFLLADTQTMSSFPGERYDFIHIDGQQDGDGTWHDLELALEKGTYILVDGFFWSKENMLSCTYFLEKYKNFLEYALILPGYAGDLLIKAKSNIYKNITVGNQTLLKELNEYKYAANYAGGCDLFALYHGRLLEVGVAPEYFYLVNPQKNENILDVGCSRGELAYACAQAGANVTAIDYARDAIAIAQKTFITEGTPASLLERLHFIQADFLTYPLTQSFDKIIATDVIEHIERAVLQNFLTKIAALIKEHGVFIVHTAPNKLYDTHGYRRKRTLARQAGSYLPPNPRTYYEDLMHINEQTPATLKRILQAYFKSVIVWTALDGEYVGTLAGAYSKQDLLRHRNIYAVASQQPLTKEIIANWLTQPGLPPEEANADIRIVERSLRFHPEEKKRIPVIIKNDSMRRYASLPPFPIHLAYHWLKVTGECFMYDGERTPIIIPLQPGEERQCDLLVAAPLQPGVYKLQITLVQEYQFWFEQVAKNLPVTIQAIVE